MAAQPVSADGGGKAPLELFSEFLNALMEKDYVLAKKLCESILTFEPDNPEAKEFMPLIEQRILMEQEEELEEEEEDEEDAEDSCDLEENDTESETELSDQLSSSSSEDESKE